MLFKALFAQISLITKTRMQNSSCLAANSVWPLEHITQQPMILSKNFKN